MPIPHGPGRECIGSDAVQNFFRSQHLELVPDLFLSSSESVDRVCAIRIVNHKLNWSALAEGLTFQVALDGEFASVITSPVGPVAFYSPKELNRLRRLLTIHEDHHPPQWKAFIVMKCSFASTHIESRETASCCE
jgi:hypothetical protein